MRKHLLLAFGLTALAVMVPGSSAQKKYKITLIPGLTTDGFYITMNKGVSKCHVKCTVQNEIMKHNVLIRTVKHVQKCQHF